MSYVTANMAEALKSHVLEEISAGEKIRAFYLKRPGEGRMMSTLFLFTPEGIAIMGDLVPDGHGSISTYGYGVGWFADILGEDYLCSKFLPKVWVREYAVEWLNDEAARLNQEAIRRESDDRLEREEAMSLVKTYRDLIDNEAAMASYETFYSALAEINPYLVDDGAPGIGYDPRAAGWLCALQQRFATAFAKHPAPAVAGA